MIGTTKTWGLFWLLISGSYLIYKLNTQGIKELFLFLLNGEKEKKKVKEKEKEENKEKEKEREKEKTNTDKNKENEQSNEERSLIEKELTDIEDINNMENRSHYRVVQIKRRKRKEKEKEKDEKNCSDSIKGAINEDEEKYEGIEDEEKKENCKNKTADNVIIPENYKIYFKSFGCSHNSSDSEFMMGLLSNHGFQFVKKVEECDICIINSCTVKNPSEESMKTIINYVKKLNGNTVETHKKREKRNNNRKINKFSSSVYRVSQNKKNDEEKGEEEEEEEEGRRRNDSDFLSTSSGFSDLEEFSNRTKEVTEKELENEKLYKTEKQKGKGVDLMCWKNEETCQCAETEKETETETETNIEIKTKTNTEDETNGGQKREQNIEQKKELKNKQKIENSKGRKQIKLIVCGCVPQAEKDMEIFENVSLVGVNNIDKIIEVVETVINGYNVKYLKMNKTMTSLSLPKIRKNKYIEIININNGCLGNCTYCKTKFARGNLVSYSIRDIIERIEYVINEENIKEIWLTSEDTGAYGIDLKTNIVELLKEILKTVEKTNVMIRIGMTNPPYILNHIANICELLKHKNMYEFIHIPVQSGSNNVLKNMKREYKIEDFIYLVENLREKVINMTIATDIICGFPYETEEDHKETIELIKKYQFPIVNISQFYPRNGTVAFNMKRINTQIVKKRSKEMTDTFLSYNKNYDFLYGTLQNVLFTEVSSRSEHLIGHTKQYVKVLLPNRNNETVHLLGKTVLCKIVSIHKWHVLAELYDDMKSET